MKKGSYAELRQRGMRRLNFFIDGDIANLAEAYAKEQGVCLAEYLRSMLVDRLLAEPNLPEPSEQK